MKNLPLYVGLAVVMLLGLGWLLWQPSTLVQQPLNTEEGLSTQLQLIADKISQVSSNMDVLQKQLATVERVTDGLAMGLENLKLKVDSNDAKLASLQGNTVVAERSDAERVSDVNEEESVSLFEVSSQAYNDEDRDESWAQNTESDVLEKFSDISYNVSISEISCRTTSCYVNWSYRNLEELTPEEIFNLEHSVLSKLGSAGLTLAVYDDSPTTPCQNIAIFVKPPESQGGEFLPRR